jgi:magnesium-transporting ATPase (P-type)
LEKGEKAPADILVLDTQHIEDREAVVYVDARSITGRVTVERKKACFLTQVTSRSAIKRNWDKYKKEYLTGKLKYELPNADMEDFLGYLKLVKDPKTSLITFENFISRESIIKTCWIYALVLHAGMNCKIMRHIGERNRNHKFFENYIDRIFAVCFVVNLILGIPYALVALSNEFLSALETSTYHLLIFSVILPHFLYFGNGLLLLYFSLKNNIDAEIINFSSIISLGSIDFAVIAYNGVLSSGKMIADEIITSSSLYDFR